VPGYDETIGLFAEFDLNEYAPHLIGPYTKDVALEPIAALRELLSECAFVDGPDSPYASVALAAVLTACVRRALPTALAFGISSPKASSGKTTIARVAAQISTGHRPAVMPYSGDEQETRKAILSVLIAATPPRCLITCRAQWTLPRCALG
jgi:hypothetical protein